ncbi:unnamed protein product [Lasius platythorax]|uniref:Uncharacterized protein n=1 Tax=Lasius platythorax TaxID=488582 RepID=A0AAV2N9Y0_9HYME
MTRNIMRPLATKPTEFLELVRVIERFSQGVISIREHLLRASRRREANAVLLLPRSHVSEKSGEERFMPFLMDAERGIAVINREYGNNEE